MKESAPSQTLDRHVGALLRGHRRAKGVSQEDLAAAIGLTFQQIQKYECGENRISVSKLVEMARALQVPVMAFFAGLETDRGEDLLARFCQVDGASGFMQAALRMPPAVRAEIFRLAASWGDQP
ncbi:helix-turn-helix domain-containing protein [Caulobacter endophyticus]|uniref:Transcriptional regulator n=1 Tax=Caulobacter endophyticus TaxID=2172652 RepID=A0A2T9KCG7_9CAUL|nr:helix-turn-helix transcriptional regulator [Caulobacter endophyticus]PVM93662.1 transcriptional regulator [Caulobacter endophyticus]